MKLPENRNSRDIDEAAEEPQLRWADIDDNPGEYGQCARCGDIILSDYLTEDDVLCPDCFDAQEQRLGA